jgi:hypothetical protein
MKGDVHLENAIFITSIKDIEEKQSKYTRIYFGAELCEKLIPNWIDVKLVLDYCIKEKYDFTFVTSYVSNLGLEKLKAIFNSINELGYDCEIIVNDWGVMNHLVKEGSKLKHLKPVIGRLLSKISKSPRIKNIYNGLNNYQKEALGKYNYSQRGIQEFWKSKNIDRYEIDNIYQEISLTGDMTTSIYFPFVLVSTTRNCLCAGLGSEIEIERGRDLCNFECKEYKFKLTHPVLQNELIYKGNGYYYVNVDLGNKLINSKITRVVYQPNI